MSIAQHRRIERKLTDAECAVLTLLAETGKKFVFVRDHVTAERLANRGLLERKPVRFANVPLYRLGGKAPAYMARHANTEKAS